MGNHDKKITIATRLFAADYLRAAMIFLVIVWHAAMVYSLLFQDGQFIKTARITFLDGVVPFLSVFVIPILFFLAGVFAISSLQVHTVKDFMIKKIIRILLPALIGLLVLNAYPWYLDQLFNHQTHLNPVAWWLRHYLPNIVHAASYAHVHLHIWYLETLFVFFIVFALLCQVWPKLINTDANFKVSKISINKTLCILVLINLIVFSILNSQVKLFTEESIVSGFLYEFNILKLPQLILFFALGVIAYRNRWLTRWTFRPYFMVWVIAGVLISIYVAWVVTHHIRLVLNNPYINWLIGALDIIATPAMLIALLSLFMRYNKPNRLLQSFARNSYMIYYIHIIVLYTWVMILHFIAISVFLKFCIVIVLTAVTSYWLSAKVLLRLPLIRRIF